MPHDAPPSQPSVLEAVLQAAVAESAALAQRALSGGEDLLRQAAAAAAGQAERRRYEAAAAGLAACRPAVVSAFPAALQDELAQRAASPASSGAFTFETLELMADDQVDDAVELARARQAVMPAVEHELVTLHALVSAARGHENVRAEGQPLRPEVWVAALHAALRAAKASPDLRSTWMFHASLALGPELAALYRRLCDRMRQQGVSAASYRVAPAQEEVKKQAEPERAPRPDSPVTLPALRRLLASVARGSAGQAEGQTQSHPQSLGHMTMPAAMEALQGMHRMDDVVRRMQERWRQGTWQAEPVGPQEAAAAERATYTPTQTLAREVVRLMVANMASDARLLPQVQEAIRALEPALLRLVARDQRFFLDRQHPARQLLDEVTRRSLAWPDAAAAGFQEFLRPLRDAVDMLARLPLEDAEPFDHALHALRQTWAESEERTRRQRTAMARALLAADQRNHLAAEIAAGLRKRADVAGAPAEVRRFLLGPWCQVMAAARLAAPEGAADPGGHDAVVNDLVWVSQPALAAVNPGRLASVGASVREALRQGLARIGYPGQEMDAFFVFLDQAQAKAKASRPEVPPQAVAPAPVPAAGEEPASDADEAPPWLLPNEVSVSGLSAEVPPDFQPTDQEPPREPLPAGEGEAVALQVGQFIEVVVRGQWKRWQLTWTSPHGMLYMFTDATGRPESMTRQMMEKLMAIGAVRLLPSGSVVDGALDAVARDALEQSARGTP